MGEGLDPRLQRHGAADPRRAHAPQGQQSKLQTRPHPENATAQPAAQDKASKDNKNKDKKSKKEGKSDRRSKASYRKSSIVLICFFTILCLASLGMLGFMLIPRLIAKNEYISLTPEAVNTADDSFSMEDLTSVFTSSQPTQTQTMTPELLAYYESVNSDFIGWLDIADTQIHYPLVRTDDNDYYLRRTFKKSYSDYGSIYADYRCADDFSDANTVIYGHNMRNGTMFHDLTRMLDSSYLSQHDTFTITTPDAQVLTYRIFSVHEVHITTNYRTITLAGSERVDYFNLLRSYSDVTAADVTFDENSRIITFSTCPNDSDDAYRIAVHAVLIDEQPLVHPE